MNCDCVTRTNERLKELNLGLDVSMVFSSGMKTVNDMLTLSTHWLDKSKAKRGKKPTAILVTFCPFCGTRATSPDTSATGDTDQTQGARS